MFAPGGVVRCPLSRKPVYRMPLQEELEVQGNWLFQRRGWLPYTILAVGLGVFAYVQTHPEAHFLKERHWWAYGWVCLAVSLVGLAIRAFTVGHAARRTSGRNTAGQVADELNTSGIYATVRHPLYVGNFLMWLGPAMLTGHAWFLAVFCLAYWLYYERIMYAEEQFLRGKFGERYVAWASGVPAFLPRVSAYRGADLAFDWPKVLRREKTGLLALAATFLAFDLLGRYLRDAEPSVDPALLAFALLSLAYYALMKVVMRGEAAPV